MASSIGYKFCVHRCIHKIRCIWKHHLHLNIRCNGKYNTNGELTANGGITITDSTSTGDVTLAALAGSGDGCVEIDNDALLSFGSCGSGSSSGGSLVAEDSDSTDTIIGDSTRNTIQIGTETNATTIDQKRISTGGKNLIKEKIMEQSILVKTH